MQAVHIMERVINVLPILQAMQMRRAQTPLIDKYK